MAIVWQTTTADNHYEVRRAGNSLRLYTNGVFHSQWNHRRPLSGHLWDLLFLPVMFYENPKKLKRALVLGVGGGSLINLLNYFLSPCLITGVDLDGVHLQIAKDFFIPERDNTELIEEDANVFISKRKTPKYDFIVEDIFCSDAGNRSDAVRPIGVDERWLRALAARLSSGGVLVINFESQAQLRRSMDKSLIKASGFEKFYQLSNQRYENAVGIYLKKAASRKYFDSQLQRFVAERSKREIGDLCFTLDGVY